MSASRTGPEMVSSDDSIACSRSTPLRRGGRSPYCLLRATGLNRRQRVTHSRQHRDRWHNPFERAQHRLNRWRYLTPANHP